MTRLGRSSSAVSALAVAGAFAASLLGAAPSANATVVITDKNVPQFGEETIQFGAQQTGLVFTGTTNQTNTPVLFTSNAILQT